MQLSENSLFTGVSVPFWCIANALSDPFGGKVLNSIDSLETAKIICWAAKKGWITHTSFHDDDLFPWDPQHPEDDLDKTSATYKRMVAIKTMLDAAGVKVNTVTCSLHGNTLFRGGGLTNSDPEIRDLAQLKVDRTLRIGAFFGATHFTYWVARDGFEVPMVVDWANVYKWLAVGLDHVWDYIKANQLNNYVGATVEPKPNEPRGYMYLPTSGHAVGFIYGMLKHPEFWSVNPELLQHEAMTLQSAVLTVSYLVTMGKLDFFHFGCQIPGHEDNDYPPLVGPQGLKETIHMVWALRKLGWKGIVEVDCHMLRAEGDPNDDIGCRKVFVENCVTAIALVEELAGRLDGFAAMKGESHSASDLRSIMAICKVSPRVIRQKMRRPKNATATVDIPAGPPPGEPVPATPAEPPPLPGT